MKITRLSIASTVLICLTIFGCVLPPISHRALKKKPRPIVPTAMKAFQGEIRLGDSLEDAKRAFPIPPEAENLPYSGIYDPQSQNYGWYTRNNRTGFDVSLERGKVVEVAISVPKNRESYVNSVIKDWGPPDVDAKGLTESIQVWFKDGNYCLYRHQHEPGKAQTYSLTLGVRRTKTISDNLDLDDPRPYLARSDAVYKVQQEMLKADRMRRKASAPAKALPGK